MAQLGGEKTGAGDVLLTVEQAAQRIAALVSPVSGTQTLLLAQADGRVLAQDVVAGLDLPPFANSAVDGYAVRFADLAAAGQSRLPVAGRVAAGASCVDVATAGVAVRIFTGAALPAGADTVFMQEDVARDGGDALFPAGLASGANIRPAGEDMARGATAFSTGCRLRPQDLGLLAALGFSEVAVRARPRVAVFSTGDELVEPGMPRGPAAVYDANRAMLLALLARTGAEVIDLGILPDDRESLALKLSDAARDCDLVMTTGGVSVGEEDHVKAAVAQRGALALWRVAIKPGRPVAMGLIGRTPFIGLPGNPVAVFVTFAFVARGLVARLAGTQIAPLVPVPVRLGFSYRKKPGRREYLRVSLEPGADGVPVARKHPGEGAGALASLTQSDGLVAFADDLAAMEEGMVVPFFAYALLLG